jgi:hypothetical protein
MWVQDGDVFSAVAEWTDWSVDVVTAASNMWLRTEKVPAAKLEIGMVWRLYRKNTRQLDGYTFL